jgi:23S rRNA pseudouridine2605 synthase
MVRINKYLASCELGSRRGVEDLIRQGNVKINGVVCQDLATQVDPDKDSILVNNKPVQHNETMLFILLNKPRGYMVTRNDEFNRKTIYDLLPDFATNLHPIGRLDYDSEGLLILTNDGDVTNKLSHPSFKVEKTYKVIVKGKLDKEKLAVLRNGIEIDEYKTQPAKVFLKKTSNEQSELRITISEGKNRQIRKMLEAVGHEVSSLKRLQIGEIKLEKMPTGTWRFLKDSELLYLLKKIRKEEK